MTKQFERMTGDRAALRSALAYIRANPPSAAELVEPMPASLLAAIGIEAADNLELTLPVAGGRASVQLLITPLGLTINRMAASANRDVLSREERSELVSLVLVEGILPAFQGTPGTSLVIIDGDVRKTLTNPPRGAE